jgi:hypothetical protein
MFGIELISVWLFPILFLIGFVLMWVSVSKIDCYECGFNVFMIGFFMTVIFGIGTFVILLREVFV